MQKKVGQSAEDLTRRVQALIREMYPSCQFLPRFEETFRFGEWVIEFQEFLQCRNLSPPAFIPRFIRTSELATSAISAFFPDTRQRISVACIDVDFLDVMARTLFECAFAATEPQSVLFCGLYKLVQHMFPGKYRTFEDASDFVAARVSPTALALLEEDISQIEELRGKTRQYLSWEYPKSFEPPTSSDLPVFINYDDIFNWIFSMAVHFSLGHETGHFLLGIPTQRELLHYLHAYADSATCNSEQCLDESFRDELICDLIAIDNCIYQAARFGVFPWLVALSLQWMMRLYTPLQLAFGGTPAFLADTNARPGHTHHFKALDGLGWERGVSLLDFALDFNPHVFRLALVFWRSIPQFKSVISEAYRYTPAEESQPRANRTEIGNLGVGE